MSVRYRPDGPRHVEIHDDNVRAALTGQENGRFASRGLTDDLDVRHVFEHRANASANQRVVVDEKNPDQAIRYDRRARRRGHPGIRFQVPTNWHSHVNHSPRSLGRLEAQRSRRATAQRSGLHIHGRTALPVGLGRRDGILPAH